MVTKEEAALIRLIRQHKDPEQALIIATDIILRFLTQPGSSEAPAGACPPGPDETV